MLSVPGFSALYGNHKVIAASIAHGKRKKSEKKLNGTKTKVETSRRQNVFK